VPKVLTLIFVFAVGVFSLVGALTRHETVWAVFLGVILVVSAPFYAVDIWRRTQSGRSLPGRLDDHSPPE
jgi:quinol-cytochrome oxidoreductase complex cytochrome b subunit